VINWRDILSMISSPVPFLGVFTSQSGSFFWQQVGSSIFLLLGDEEVRVMKAVPRTSTAAVINSILIFFMVVV
jgi:hypothetical protein